MNVDAERETRYQNKTQPT